MKYEALILGLKATKDLGVDKLATFGDSQLIVQQMKNIYQLRQPNLKTYQNEVWGIVESIFLAFDLSYISRDINQLDDSLATKTSIFKVPQEIQAMYEIQLNYRPSVPDNIKHQQVFEYHQELKKLLQCVEEFSIMQIYQNEEEDGVVLTSNNYFRTPFLTKR